MTSDDGLCHFVDQVATERSTPTLGERAAAARKALLLVLRAAEAPVASNVRDARTLPREVAELHGSAVRLQALIQELVLDPSLLGTLAARQALPNVLYQRLRHLLPETMTLAEFAALNVFAQHAAAIAAPTLESPTSCVLVHGGRELEFTLGTVASMKGETYLASLLPESYGGKSKRFDLELALPDIAGLGNDLNKLSLLQQRQIRSVYVAMSRPTRFLCLAAHASRVAEETCAALVTKGWRLERLS